MVVVREPREESTRDEVRRTKAASLDAATGKGGQRSRRMLAACALTLGTVLLCSASARAQDERKPGSGDLPPPTTSGDDPRGDSSAPSPSTTGSGPGAGAAATPTSAPQEPPRAPDVAAVPSSPAPLAPPPPPEPAAKRGTVEITGEPGKGLTMNIGERFSLNVRTRIQLRYQLHVPPKGANGERNLDQIVNIGTARLWISGHVYKPELTYMIQLALAGRDYRDGAISPIYDAFLDWKLHRDFAVRAGQYFVPFDRLRTVREFGLQMADRPRPVGELTLDRDVGVSFYSERFLGDRSPFAWRLGAFGGGGTNLVDAKKPGVLLVGRLELRPLGAIDDDLEGDLERRSKPGLAIGTSVAGNWNTNRVRSTTGPRYVGGTTDYQHAAADLVFKWLGVALQAEYLWRQASNDRIISINPDGTTLTEYTRSGTGWVLQASYIFDPPIEIVGRLSRLSAFSGTDPRFVTEAATAGQETAAGLNYYFNGHRMKLQADWIARTPTNFDFSRADHLVHLQLDATF